jgi:curli biogenesis system outer membrane secretion channel CsgG
VAGSALLAATVALSVARLTLTRSTPGTRASARSTRATQLAQVMPSMGRVSSVFMNAESATRQRLARRYPHHATTARGAGYCGHEALAAPLRRGVAAATHRRSER